MRVSIVHPRELGDADLVRWRRYIGDDGLGSPFLTPTFALTVGAHDGASRVAVLEDGAGRVAYFPFDVDEERVGLPFGRGMSDAQAFIGPPDFECDLPDLVQRLGVREWRFDHVVPGQERFAPYRHSLHGSPVLDLKRGHDAYVREVRESSNVLKQIARFRRNLVRDAGEVSVVWDTARAADVDTLVAWKAEQYAKTGARDLFAEPWRAAVLHDLVAAGNAECRGVVGALKIGDRPIALHLCLVRDEILHSWFPVYNEEFAKYSPGLILLLDQAAEAASHGIGTIDLGRGDQPYKLRVANSSYEVAEGRVAARSAWSRAVILARHPGWLLRKLKLRR